jgi:hypothetical protein
LNNEFNAQSIAKNFTEQPKDFSAYVVNTGSTFEQTTVKVPANELGGLPNMGNPYQNQQQSQMFVDDSGDDLPF